MHMQNNSWYLVHRMQTSYFHGVNFHLKMGVASGVSLKWPLG